MKTADANIDSYTAILGGRCLGESRRLWVFSFSRFILHVSKAFASSDLVVHCMLGRLLWKICI